MVHTIGKHRPITSRFPLSSSRLKPSNKLYLGDLPFKCTPQEIEGIFYEHGYATMVIVFHGFGFAHFHTTMLAREAHDELQGKIHLFGRTLRIHYAGRFITDQTPINTLTSPINSVYVHFRTNSDVHVDEAFLTAFFAPYGTVIDVCIKDVRKVSVWMIYFSLYVSIVVFFSSHHYYHYIVSLFVGSPIQASWG